MVGRAMIALTEPVMMMRPALRGIITRAASRASTQTAVRLVSITRLKSAASNSVIGLRCWMPAFATRMSKRPCRCAMPWMQAAHAFSSVTSNAAASPFSPALQLLDTADPAWRRSRPLMIDRAPGFAPATGPWPSPARAKRR